MMRERAWAHSLDGTARWIDHPSRVGEVRRTTRALAEEIGWSDHRAEEAAIVASEMASNLVRHAEAGWLLTQRSGAAIELTALDQGPGMVDPDQCFVDGFSTSGTAGIGMGAIRRLSDTYDLYTRPGEGTALFARLGPEPLLGVKLGAATRPFPGQTCNGDGWRIDRLGSIVRLLVSDGLGHGPEAARASTVAGDAFAASDSDDPIELLGRLDRALVGTRGVAATVAVLDLESRDLSFAGVGNVAAVYERGEETDSLVPRFGVLGAGAPVDRLKTVVHRWRPGCRLVLYSDGISERWRGSLRRSRRRTAPALLAGRILRDHLRRNDDATCVVLAPGAET